MAALIGTGYQFYFVKTHQALSYSLPLSLSVMMLLRIPNQVCVARKESHGWLSVYGFSYSYDNIYRIICSNLPRKSEV